MTGNIILSGNEARSAIVEGMTKIKNAVGATYGPGGRNVVLMGYKSGVPITTKDGVTVAKSITLSKIEEEAGAALLKTAAAKTNDIAGDGTTTTVVLAAELAEKLLEEFGGDPSAALVKKKLENLLVKCEEEIDKITIQVDSNDLEMLYAISEVAAGSLEIGAYAAEAWHKVGANGHVSHQYTQLNSTSVEVTDGLFVDRGFVDKSFANNKPKQCFESKDCIVFVTNHRIQMASDLMPVLNALITKAKATNAKTIVMMADEWGMEALSLIITNINKLNKEGISICPVLSPKFPHDRDERLEDIATYLGCVFVNSKKDMSLKDCTYDMYFGGCESVASFEDRTIFTKGFGDISKLTDELNTMLKSDSLNQNEKADIEKRIASLTGKTAVIKVGAQNITTQIEQGLRIEDSIHALRGALQDGVVIGSGGWGLHLFKYLVSLNNNVADIVADALYDMVYLLVLNQGFDSSSQNSLTEYIEEGEGVTVSGEGELAYFDPKEKKIFDSKRAVINSLRSAFNLAGIALLTEVLVTDDVEAMLKFASRA